MHSPVQWSGVDSLNELNQQRDNPRAESKKEEVIPITVLIIIVRLFVYLSACMFVSSSVTDSGRTPLPI